MSALVDVQQRTRNLHCSGCSPYNMSSESKLLYGGTVGFGVECRGHHLETMKVS